MLTPEQIWTVIGGVAAAGVAAIKYLVMPGIDSNRKRQEQLEEDNREVVKLQKDYIKTATESSAINAATNAKQAADLAAQSTHLHLISTAVNAVSSKADLFHEAFQEFVHIGRLFIKQVPDKIDQQAAQKHLDEIVSILGHKR